LTAMCPSDTDVVDEIVMHFFPHLDAQVGEGAEVIPFPLSERLQANGQRVDL